MMTPQGHFDGSYESSVSIFHKSNSVFKLGVGVKEFYKSGDWEKELAAFYVDARKNEEIEVKRFEEAWKIVQENPELKIAKLMQSR